MLDTAVTTRVPADQRKSARNQARVQSREPGSPSLRRDLGEDFAPRRRSVASAANLLNEEDEDIEVPRRTHLSGLRLRLGRGIPRSVMGRVLGGCAVLAVLGAAAAGAWELRALLLRNPRLVLASSSAIQTTGNDHLTRAQLLTVFGEDVDRNILTVPIEVRRAELERLPWVEHATVMRLLPNRIRVAITERTPVAFVRHGSSIGLVDAHGVLLNMASNADSSDSDAPAEPEHYSFPVVTGIAASDPLSVRAARMKLFTRFISDLGDDAKNISEVDLSSPEDVKALIPNGTSDILVHFGEDNFLHRYDLYQKNLPGWRKEFPKLASADMRYERQVVLEMQPGSSVPVAGAANADDSKPAVMPAAKATPAAAPKPAPKAAVQPAKAPAKPKPTAAKAPAAPAKPVVKAAALAPGQHLQTSFDVAHKPAPAKAGAKPTQAGQP